jgi:hypothetical protein
LQSPSAGKPEVIILTMRGHDQLPTTKTSVQQIVSWFFFKRLDTLVRFDFFKHGLPQSYTSKTTKPGEGARVLLNLSVSLSTTLTHRLKSTLAARPLLLLASTVSTSTIQMERLP